MFGPLFSFARKIEMMGLDANGNRSVFLPFKLVITGDMCFLMKMTLTGGACKVSRLVCLYCECNGSGKGDNDIFHVVTGQGNYAMEDQDTHTRPERCT